jgi:glucoamylase
MDLNYVYTHLDVSNMSFETVARYMQVLMLRNFATSTWAFAKDTRNAKPGKVESIQGCIIASPSSPKDEINDTDQDYVHHWVRDAALCVVEAIDNPIFGDAIFEHYVRFSRLCQENIDRPCFLIDGTPRDWEASPQDDGPALRILSVLDVFDRLAPGAQAQARDLVRADLDRVLAAYQQTTYELWEERKGYSFFARSVQKKALERLAAAADTFGITARLGDMDAAEKWLNGALAAHCSEGPGPTTYRSLLGGPGSPGCGLNADIVMTVVYGAGSPKDEVMLSTAAQLLGCFMPGGSDSYDVNADGARPVGVGPLVGRYPGDVYDGTVFDGGSGHPWPVCTCAFAELYYRVAAVLRDEPASVPWNENTKPFFETAGIADSGDGHTVQKLIAAGDRMLCAVIYHSDHLALSEQFNRTNGYELSVRSLTWSYASYLHAVRTRTACFGSGFGGH